MKKTLSTILLIIGGIILFISVGIPFIRSLILVVTLLIGLAIFIALGVYLFNERRWFLLTFLVLLFFGLISGGIGYIIEMF